MKHIINLYNAHILSHLLDLRVTDWCQDVKCKHAREES